MKKLYYFLALVILFSTSCHSGEEVVNLPDFLNRDLSIDNHIAITQEVIARPGGGDGVIRKLPFPKNTNVRFSLLSDSYDNQTATFDSCLLTSWADDLDLSSIQGNPINGKVACPCMFIRPDKLNLKGTLRELIGRYQFKATGRTDNTGSNASNSFYDAVIYPDSVVLQAHEVEYIDNYGLGYDPSLWMLCLGKISDPDDYNSIHSPFHIRMEIREDGQAMDVSEYIESILSASFIKSSDFGFSDSGAEYISLDRIYQRLGCITDKLMNYRCKFYHLSPDGNGKITNKLSFAVNTFSYLWRRDGKSFYLFVDAHSMFDDIWMNPAAGEKGIYAQTPTPKNMALLSNVLLALTPQTADGIPMKFDVTKTGLLDGIENDSEYSYYFEDMGTAVKVLKAIIGTILEKEEDKLRLFEVVSKNYDNEDKFQDFKYFVNNIDDVFDKTVTLEFGSNYTVLPYFNEQLIDNGIYRQIFDAIYK